MGSSEPPAGKALVGIVGAMNLSSRRWVEFKGAQEAKPGSVASGPQGLFYCLVGGKILISQTTVL